MIDKLTNGQKDDIERLIDRHSIENVLEAIIQICEEKSQHLATMWQDTTLAKRWDKLARTLDHASIEAEDL